MRQTSNVWRLDVKGQGVVVMTDFSQRGDVQELREEVLKPCDVLRFSSFVPRGPHESAWIS